MNLEDLILNLIAEAVGIVVTVLIIDRLIKNQEEKRWVPTKNHIYAKLFEILDDFLRAMHVNPVKDPEKTKAYSYGKRTVLGSGSYEGVNLHHIHENIEVEYNLLLLTDEKFDLEPVSSLKSQVATILDVSFTVFEPELLERLNDLEERIANLEKFLPDKTKLSMQDNASDTLLMLASLISEVITVRIYLEQKANRIIPIDRYVEELTNALKSDEVL